MASQDCLYCLLLFQAYMDSFATSLTREYIDQGITVQTLLPIFVANENAGQANLLVPTASNYAHQAIHTLGWVDRTNGSLTHTVQVSITTKTDHRQESNRGLILRTTSSCQSGIFLQLPPTFISFSSIILVGVSGSSRK